MRLGKLLTKAPAGRAGGRLPSRIRSARLAGVLALVAATAACGGEPSAEQRTAPTSGGQISVEQQQAQLAAQFGLADPPEIEVVRTVTPEERGPLVEACMTERGYSAQTLMDGIPVEQESALKLAEYSCMAAYPIVPEYTRPWGDEQVAKQYDWTINRVIPCLEARGHEITDVPSREVFISDWFTDSFYPFAQLGRRGVTSEELAELERDCPQNAPTADLFGKG